MKVESNEKLACYELRIIAETRDEALYLSSWNNCVLSAKYELLRSTDPNFSALLIIKEA